MLTERAFLQDKNLTKWLIDNKIYKWDIRKAEYWTDKEWVLNYEWVDWLTSRIYKDKETGEAFIYTLSVPTFKCDIVYQWEASNKEDKQADIAVFYYQFKELIKISKSIEELKEKFEINKWKWLTSYLFAKVR